MGFGSVVIVKRDGTDGSRFRVSRGRSLTVGSGRDCSIRIKSAGVARRHCVVTLSRDGRAELELDSERERGARPLRHGDVFAVADAATFRWEGDADSSPGSASGSGSGGNVAVVRPQRRERLDSPPAPLDRNKRAAFANMTPPRTRASRTRTSAVLPSPRDVLSSSTSPSRGLGLVSFISTLARALDVVNDPDAARDLDAVARTPEFRALDRRFESAGKRLDVAVVDRSPSEPRVLEIGAPRRPRPHLPDPSLSPPSRNYDDESDASTPNLSALFAVVASTPIATATVTTPERRARRPSRRAPDSLSLSTPTTGGAAARPSTRTLKERHSTAKKPVSRRPVVDRLAGSPAVAKELFASPVKRKLSQSIRRYTDSIARSPDGNDRRSLRTPESARSADDSRVVTNLSKTPGAVKSPKNVSKTPEPRKSNTPKPRNTPKDGPTNISSAKKSLKTPEPVKSPKNDSTNVSSATKSTENDSTSARRSLRTPESAESKTPNASKSKNYSGKISGARRSLRTPGSVKSPNVFGLKRLMKTPKPIKSPKNDLRNVSGVRRLLKTPEFAESPNVSGLKNLMKTPKPVESPKVSGFKKLMKTPKPVESPKVSGLKKLMKTPKPVESPKVSGLKKLMKTPKPVESPKVSGLKKLMKTPKPVNSPKNDLRNVSGVRHLLKTPEFAESPNVSGLKKLMKTPKPVTSPKNESRNVSGVKKLLRRSAKNDLTNVSGVADLFASKSPGRESGANRHDTCNAALLFDSLLGRSPHKFYSKGGIEKDDGGIIQDMKSAFMEFGVALRKIAPDVSTVVHETPQKNARTRNLKPKIKIKISPKAKSTRSKKVEEKSIKVRPAESASAKNVKALKSVLSPAKKEVKLSKKLSTQKKKVSFASEVNTIHIENTTNRRGRSTKPAGSAKIAQTKEEIKYEINKNYTIEKVDDRNSRRATRTGKITTESAPKKSATQVQKESVPKGKRAKAAEPSKAAQKVLKSAKTSTAVQKVSKATKSSTTSKLSAAKATSKKVSVDSDKPVSKTTGRKRAAASFEEPTVNPKKPKVGKEPKKPAASAKNKPVSPQKPKKVTTISTRATRQRK